jgi:hypothetical protein
MNNAIPVNVVDHTTYTNNAANLDANGYEEKKQPKKCRDPIFAALLYANVIAIAGLAIAYGSNPFSAPEEDNDPNDDAEVFVDYTGFLYSALASGGAGIVVSAFALQILMCIPGMLIKCAIFFQIGLAVATTAYMFSLKLIFPAILSAIFLAIFVCYACAIWSRIPFATANLITGISAIKANCGVTIIAYLFAAMGFAWVFLWFVAVAGFSDQFMNCVSDGNGGTVCSSPNYVILFFLFLSLFFTQQVLNNCVHVTVAGTVGTWWFAPQDSGCCAGAVVGSFVRTMTTSFGSICFGSLLVAIIEALRQVAAAARDNDDCGQAIVCCIDCILSILQSIIEYFNKWAFIYVGLYGYGYLESGKNVMQLFKDRGWEAVIADDIVGMVLFMMNLLVGLITGCVGLVLESQTTWFDSIEDALDDNNAVRIIAFFIGFVIGLVLCGIVMSTVASSVNATIVLFAEAPAEFEQNYPKLSTQMRDAYTLAHPGCC